MSDSLLKTDRMKPYTRKDLLAMAENQRKFNVMYHVKGVYEAICEYALKGETQYTTNMVFPQHLIEEAKVSLQEMFPDSKIDIVEKTFCTPSNTESVWNWNFFTFATKRSIETKYRAIQIDWS